jgi:drug/metabolite transporter (DMT)-like permease
VCSVGVGAILASIGGVLLISRPSFLFGHSGVVEGGGFASLVALLGSFSASAAMLTLRAIGKRGGERAAVVAHATALFSVLAAPLPLLLAPGAFSPIVGPQRFSLFPTLVCCVGAGVFSVGNQYLNNWGGQLAPAGLCAMMRNTDVVCSFVWQVLFFGAAPTLSSGAGAAIIVVCSVATALRQYWKAKAPTAKPNQTT